MSFSSFLGEDCVENTEWKLPALINASQQLTAQNRVSSLVVQDTEDSDSEDDLPLQELIRMTTQEPLEPVKYFANYITIIETIKI